ncbi:hypothetical protein JCM33374_g3018 [Metschnikowia sp. JCM 33374]|nr:hypothetical protein JCM33374_g3018 [Metschnikowia sp. JCM 33374]
MSGDGLYLTTYECALAVVATSMKKARLSIDTLIINSFIGGILFTSGGMLHVMVQAESPLLLQENPGILHLFQGLLYPIGLFYVVIMGVDLFNSNILFFSVGVARGAVSILDLLISWTVSWWFNLVGNIFVCYIICHYSAVMSSAAWVTGSVAILNQKLEANFVQTLLKAMAGNFFVCLAIYMQLMAKPIHVKFLLMVLPVFTFVSLGFTHSVADMFMIVIGLINGAPTSVATVAWKLFLPGAIGNIIGGSFFGLVIPWYLHIVAVERDQKKLNLPRYDMRDQQPEINQDSRVVRGREEAENEDDESENGSESGGDETGEKHVDANAYVSDGISLRSPSIISRKTYSMVRSPSKVFPVYGMGPPGERERSIASGFTGEPSKDGPIASDSEPNEHRKSATFIGDSLLRTLSRTQTKKDIEAQRKPPRDDVSSLTPNRGYSSSRTPQSIIEGNSYFSRTKTNEIPPNRLRRSSTTRSGVPPEAILEHSSNEATVSPHNSLFDVKAYDPADHV